MVVTTTLAELDRAAHAAVDASVPMPAPARTGGGSRLPMRDLIGMAASAIHYLAVFDDHTERPLYLGRQKRVATADQRLICYARDRGCTRPNCLESGYRCEVHHSPDWARGGRTDADKLFFACGQTTAWRAVVNCAPGSPKAAGWAGPTAPVHPKSTTPTTPTNSSAETRTRLTANVSSMIGDRWNVTDDEVARHYPCDDFVHTPTLQAWRGITVQHNTRDAVAVGWPDQARAILLRLDRQPRPSLATAVDGLARARGRRAVYHCGNAAASDAFLPSSRPNSSPAKSSEPAFPMSWCPMARSTRLLMKIITPMSRWLTPWLSVGDLIMARRQLLNLKRLAERH